MLHYISIKLIFLQAFDEDDVMAHALVFFFAGFETSFATLTFALMEIARFPEVQKKARKDIEEVLERHNGVMSYQALQEMNYLVSIMQGAAQNDK
jgi:cytochrome P450 family 6